MVNPTQNRPQLSAAHRNVECARFIAAFCVPRARPLAEHIPAAYSLSPPIPAIDRVWAARNQHKNISPMLRFESQLDFIEIDLASQATADVPWQGDGYLTIRVSSAGFTGHNDLWIPGPALGCFSRALIALECHRQGEAVLESMSPDELRLVVRAVDSRGHMLIEGFTGFEVQRENSRLWHSVDFGFEFDPSQLLRAASVDWVKRNAEPGAPPGSP